MSVKDSEEEREPLELVVDKEPSEELELTESVDAESERS